MRIQRSFHPALVSPGIFSPLLHMSYQYLALFQIYCVCKKKNGPNSLYPSLYLHPFQYNLGALRFKRWSLFLYPLNWDLTCDLHWPIKRGENDIMPVSDLGLRRLCTRIPCSPRTLPVSQEQVQASPLKDDRRHGAKPSLEPALSIPVQLAVDT